jgi:hypothetical protein
MSEVKRINRRAVGWIVENSDVNDVAVLHLNGFYDDPKDASKKGKTICRMEIACEVTVTRED